MGSHVDKSIFSKSALRYSLITYLTKTLAFLLNAKYSQQAAQKNNLFHWLVSNTPQSSSLKENSFSKTESGNLLMYSLTIIRN